MALVAAQPAQGLHPSLRCWMGFAGQAALVNPLVGQTSAIMEAVWARLAALADGRGSR